MSGTLYILMARGCGGCSHFKTHFLTILQGFLKKNNISFVEMEALSPRAGFSDEQLENKPEAIKSHIPSRGAWFPAFMWIPADNEDDVERASVLFATWNPRSEAFTLDPEGSKLPTNSDIGGWLRSLGAVAEQREPLIRYRGSTPNANRYGFAHGGF